MTCCSVRRVLRGDLYWYWQMATVQSTSDAGGCRDMVWLLRKPLCWWTFMVGKFLILSEVFRGIPKCRSWGLVDNMGLFCPNRINTELLNSCSETLPQKPTGLRGVGRLEILKDFFQSFASMFKFGPIFSSKPIKSAQSIMSADNCEAEKIPVLFCTKETSWEGKKHCKRSLKRRQGWG